MSKDEDAAMVPCCGSPARCIYTDPCETRIRFHEATKITDVQQNVNDSTHGSKKAIAYTMPMNPKQAYGDTKVPLHLFPMPAIALGAMGMLEGRQKYGQDNVRAAPVEAMTYVRAAMSHIFLYAEGEWLPNDSLVPHLGLALSCIGILIDAHYAGSLIDNRKFPGGYAKAIAEMQPLVQKIRDMHADKSPKQYTIADAPEV